MKARFKIRGLHAIPLITQYIPAYCLKNMMEISLQAIKIGLPLLRKYLSVL